jgi:DNA-binding NarL/FixJ family response regulator
LTLIAVCSPSPLVSGALVSVLAAVPGWQARAQPNGEGADVLVLCGCAPPRELNPMLPLVVIGEDMSDPALLGGQRASALLPASATAPQVVAAVGAVLQGLCVREAGAGLFAPQPAAPGEYEPLTPREIEVYELIGKGLSNRDIAGVLGISAHTAKYHVAQILAKVGAATRAEAVGTGLRLGLIGV